MLMMLYNPGSRTGLAEELSEMQEKLTKEDRDLKKIPQLNELVRCLDIFSGWCLKKMIDGLVPKLGQISDTEFDQILDACL